MKKFAQPILVTQAFLPPYEEYCAALKSIWESHWMTNNGKLHNKLQEELEKYLHVRNITLFVNGHSALDVAVKALGLKGEVITTPFTFASTTHALVMNGLKPVFCDIKLSDFTIDENKIEALITPRTSAIVAVHVYGYPCNVKKIEALAEKYNLKVIYDAAHAFGVNIGGTAIGNFGDVSMMSFHATKVFNTIEGGALLYNNDGYRRLFDLYKNFGITGPETVEAVGLNAKMNEFQALMGLLNLKYTTTNIAKRKLIVEKYREILKTVPGIRVVGDIPNVKSNYAYFPIIVDSKEYGMNRDQLANKMEEYNVFVRKYFYPLTCDFKCFNNKFKNVEVENARFATNNVITLPLYADLSLSDTESIATIIKDLGNG
jgi:dTDP-4-amino-4,6-dideoxygalactose transaminase